MSATVQVGHSGTQRAAHEQSIRRSSRLVTSSSRNISLSHISETVGPINLIAQSMRPDHRRRCESRRWSERCGTSRLARATNGSRHPWIAWKRLIRHAIELYASVAPANVSPSRIGETVGSVNLNAQCAVTVECIDEQTQLSPLRTKRPRPRRAVVAASPRRANAGNRSVQGIRPSFPERFTRPPGCAASPQSGSIG